MLEWKRIRELNTSSKAADDDDGVHEKPRKERRGKAVQAPTKATRAADEIPIPVGTWPVSVKGEETETMVHVGDMKTIMTVPKFWSPPVHNNKQFTREQAMQIGTCAEPDPVTGSNVRGEDCPVDQRTIFIGLASYRDFQCRLTLESAFLRAKNPKRIRVGVIDQVVVGEDVACDEPVKPCEEDPEQVCTNSLMLTCEYCITTVLSLCLVNDAKQFLTVLYFFVLSRRCASTKTKLMSTQWMHHSRLDQFSLAIWDIAFTEVNTMQPNRMLMSRSQQIGTTISFNNSRRHTTTWRYCRRT